MSRDPDNYYEEEYWEEIGRQEKIAAAIKNLSEEPIREFLATYGDALDARVDNTVAQAQYASQSGFPGGRFAVGTGISCRLKMTRPTQAAHLLLPQFAQ